MITLIIFLTLCTIETIFFYLKYKEVKKYKELGVHLSTLLFDKNIFEQLTIMFSKYYKPLIILLLIINFVISYILGAIIDLILVLC